MIRPLLLAAAVLAPALAASAAGAQALPPASSAPAAASPPSVSGDAGGGAGRYGRMNMSPEMRQARQAMVQACSADFARLCADAAADGGGGGAAGQSGGGQGGGGGGRMQCLRQHMSEVSDGCRSSMQAMRAARQAGGAPPPTPNASPQG